MQFRTLLLVFALSACFVSAYAQLDIEIFNKYIQSATNTSNNNSLAETALFFLDASYKANTLEVNNTEQLVVNLREFDCTTLVEICLALHQTIKHETPQYETFLQNLQLIRYREGKIDDYTSRLHYITDWITDNVSKGIIIDRTKELGGKLLNVNVNYMTTHPQQYPALKGNSRLIAQMETIEKSINTRKNTYYYIPKGEISRIEKAINTGDIIFFTTSLAGLDVTHAGIACRVGNKLTFIHASSKHGKVVINPESLNDYCASNKNNTGIIVVQVQ